MSFTPYAVLSSSAGGYVFIVIISSCGPKIARIKVCCYLHVLAPRVKRAC